jgi:hypothetical protein
MPLPYGESRSLTPLETVLALKVFGTSIQYIRVKIHHGKYIGIQPDHAAMTPNGEIYFPTPLYEDDYSVAFNDWQKHLFIHEMAHVWQYQLGYPVMATGLIESVIGSINGYGYDYTLKPNSKLSDYPMEAQANIIADYAIYLLYNQPRHHSRRRYGKPPYSLPELQAVLADFISNPSSAENLPKVNKRSNCETEPNTADCLTR